MNIRVWAAATLLATFGVTRADTLGDARRHYLNGAKAYEEGEFQRAIDEYRASYDLSRRPLLLYDLGQAYRKLGNHELSLHSYKQFLARSTESREQEYRDIASVQIEQLEALIAEQQRVKAAPPDSVTNPEKPTAAALNPTEPPPAASPTPLVVAAPSPTKLEPKPARKRAWVWGVVGGVLATGVALGVGLGVGLQSTPPKAVDGAVTF